jgi:hypothetical protein
MWVHDIVSSTVSQRLPQKMFYPHPSRNWPSLTKTQNVSGYFPFFSADCVPEVFEMYALQLPARILQLQFIALNVLLRIFLDYGLYLVIQKVDTLTVVGLEPRPYRCKPETAYGNDGAHVRWFFYFDIMFFMFRSPEN